MTSPPPATLSPGGLFGLTVAVEDKYGNLATSYDGTVTLALANNPGGGTLSGNLSEMRQPDRFDAGERRLFRVVAGQRRYRLHPGHRCHRPSFHDI